MELSKRKKIELAGKLAGLRQEWDQWRSESSACKPLEKHHSQIHRVTVRLEALQAELLRELCSVPDDSPQLLTQARRLEQLMLEVHRVWEFFRSKFSLRRVEWFSKYLIAADDLAWDCYRAAQEKLSHDYLPAKHVKEPPLVFFNGGSSPFTQARDEAFEAEAVPGEELMAGAAQEVLRALPIPVIGVPWFQVQHLPEALVIAHEVGHDVESDFRLTAELGQALEAGLARAGTDEARRGAWRSWLGEIFADVYGALACGPAFTGALMDFLATDVGKTERARRQAPNWGLYPTDYLRVLINLEVLRQQGFTAEPPRLLGEWAAVYKEHEMGEFVPDIAPVVEAILARRLAAFGGLTLTEVISFTQAEQAVAVTDAARINMGLGPEATNVRTLFAAARIAFSSNPEDYGRRGAHALVLDRASQIRVAGVRSSRASWSARPGALDEGDKEEGAALFRILRNAAPRV